MPAPRHAPLLRTLGTWDLTAISMNTIVGSGIFLLPAAAAAAAGAWAPLAFLASGLVSLVLAMIFAEATGRFSDSGGPYLAARAAFGGFAGFEVAWIFWLSRLAAVGAAYNVLLSYLALFVPAVAEPGPRLACITALVLAVMVVNIRGVRAGAIATNVFTVAKLAPLVGLALGGGLALALGDRPLPVTPAPEPGDFARAVLLVAFAYGGFEMATVPGGESRDPARDVPRALFLSIGGAILLYCALQFVLFGLYPALGGSERPVADAASALVGTSGAALVAAAALLSTVGYLFGASLTVPRISFALAEQGQFPACFARVHPRWRSPWVSIVLHAAITWALAAGLGFFSLVMVNVLGRLIVAGATSAALLRLRRRLPPVAGAYLAPLGPAVPLGGLVFVAVLLTQVKPSEAAWGLAALAVGAAAYPLLRPSR
jgi:amino acid transporter